LIHGDKFSAGHGIKFAYETVISRLSDMIMNAEIVQSFTRAAGVLALMATLLLLGGDQPPVRVKAERRSQNGPRMRPTSTHRALLKMTVLKIRTGRRWPKLVDVVTGLSVAAVLLLLTYAGLQGEIALSQLDALGVTPIY